MQELLSTTAHDLRLVYRAIDAGLESPWPNLFGQLVFAIPRDAGRALVGGQVLLDRV